MFRLVFLYTLCIFSVSGFAATVDTIAIRSKSMGISKKCVVIVPEAKEKTTRFPVVYLLHGHGGSFANWINRVPQITRYADEYNLIIVCPDGDYDSWYFDSPLNPKLKYETYISREVPEYIDAHYPTINNRHARAITGLSMGGHGALLIAFRHAGRFSAAGSMSGVVDLAAGYNKYGLDEKIGDTAHFAANWKNLSVVKLIETPVAAPLALTIDCGIRDVFLPYNRKLHEKMLALNIAHDYSERPGGHDWKYWGNSIAYHLLFFRKHFNKMKESSTG